jgi:hypothetical protein
VLQWLADGKPDANPWQGESAWFAAIRRKTHLDPASNPAAGRVVSPPIQINRFAE